MCTDMGEVQVGRKEQSQRQQGSALIWPPSLSDHTLCPCHLHNPTNLVLCGRWHLCHCSPFAILPTCVLSQPSLGGGCTVPNFEMLPPETPPNHQHQRSPQQHRDLHSRLLANVPESGSNIYLDIDGLVACLGVIRRARCCCFKCSGKLVVTYSDQSHPFMLLPFQN